MDQESGTALYIALNHNEKLQMLASIGFNLTVAARDTYDDEGGVRDTQRLRSLTEVQHRCLARLRTMLADQSQARMSDDAFVAMFFAPRDDKPLSRLLAFAFEQAAGAIRKAQPSLGRTG